LSSHSASDFERHGYVKEETKRKEKKTELICMQAPPNEVGHQTESGNVLERVRYPREWEDRTRTETTKERETAERCAAERIRLQIDPDSSWPADARGSSTYAP
jgi:hypothetical protein